MNIPKKDQRGGSLVLVTVALAAIFAFAALAIDVGNVYTQRNRIQDAIDSGALAGVVSWAGGKSAGVVGATVRAFALTNTVQSSDIQSVETGYWIKATRTFVATSSLPLPLPAGSVPSVRVVARRSIPMYFATVIGFSAMSPRLEAIAVAGNALVGIRVLPWAMCYDTPEKMPCSTVTLKFTPSGASTNSCEDGAGSSQFGSLALGGSGAGVYGKNILEGYSGILRVGDCVDVEPGNMVGPTFNNLRDRLEGLPAYNCTVSPPSDPPNNKRLAILPAIDNLDFSGRNKVCIRGFYVVVLDDLDQAKKTVTARFLYSYQGDEVDAGTAPLGGRVTAVGLVK